MKKLDLHMHPLCHEYYNGRTLPHNIVINEQDKKRIRDIIHWCILRGIDVISITDHDMISPSLYAIKYVKEQGLPIIIIPGIEMELHDVERIHLCAWGINEQPKYSHLTPVKEVISMIHSMGGKIIMNHPDFSLNAFKYYYYLLDGYEYINSDDKPFDEGREYLLQTKHPLLEYRNSDYHYQPSTLALSINPKHFPIEINIWEDIYTQEWLKQFGG